MKIFTNFLFNHLTGVLKFLLLLILFSFFGTGNLSAQLVSSCPNSDFSEGNFNSWIGCYGVFSNSCQTPGFLTTGPHPLFKIIPAPGWIDNVNTCDSLLNFFPGNLNVARIGDTAYTPTAVNKAAEIKYPVTVNSSSYLFIYRYAVVLQSGGHIPVQQPDFRIQITDLAGDVLDSTCGYYHISAPTSGPPPPGWHVCNSTPHGAAYWKEWTTVGMDLTPYFGQTVYVDFKVRGCTFNTHFGYAYISAYCGYLQVHTSLCQGDSTAMLIAPPGFTYLWSNNATTDTIIVPHPVTGQTYSCTLTALNGCQVTITDTLTYTVIHSNFMHGIGCATLPMQFNDSSYVNQNAVTGWTWNFGDASPIVTGNPNPTHIYATSGNFSVTLISSSTDGCRDTIVKVIQVDSLPTIINAQRRQRICNNAMTNINLVPTVSNTLYTWTTTVSSPNISGYSNNTGSPSLFTNQTLTNSGNTLDSVTYHFTPHSSLCTGTTADFVVVVCPVPKLLTAPLSQSICDSLNPNILLTSNVDSTRFTWTCTENVGNHLSGYSDYTTMPGLLNISQVIYNSGFNVDTLHYHITGNAYGCSGSPYDYKVIVKPMPDLSNVPLTKSLCSLDFTATTLTSHVAGTLFTWTCTASGPGITGWANNAVPSTTLNQQLANPTLLPGTVTYFITPHANGCDGHIYSFVVTVKPIPIVTNSVNPAICSGFTTNILLQSNLLGTTYTWTATGSSPNVMGYSNGSGNIIAQTLVNSGFSIETVLYSVTPANNGCTGSGSGITVTVYPVADATSAPTSQVLCSAAKTSFTLSSHVAGATFTWTATGSSGNVNGFSAGAGPFIGQTLNNTGNAIEFVTYIVHPTANGCPGTQDSVKATVNPVPSVSYALCNDNITTSAAQPMKLSGGIPLGGSYSGPGVAAGKFNPAIAGIGNQTITYSYMNYLGCSRNASQTISVVNVPAFICGNDLIDIRDNTRYPTIKLGVNCWMSTNLRFGTTIPSSNMQRNNCTNEKYCYQDVAANCTNYGGLYQWDEMMRYDNAPAVQGFCPPGWHVPTENEWNTLFLLYTSNGFAGSPLKYSGYSGFNAYLTGVEHMNISWDFTNFAIMYWSSSEETPYKAWAHGMNNYNPSVSYYPSSKTNAFAIRCIQD